MVLDQAKVNRLCILLLHRLHASKVSKSCFQFCPLYFSFSETFFAPLLFILHAYFKKGVEKEDGNISVFQIGAHLFTEFCCHS